MTFDELQDALRNEGLEAAIALAEERQELDACRVLRSAETILANDPSQLAAQLALRLDTPLGEQAARRCRLRRINTLPVETDERFTGRASSEAINAMLCLRSGFLLTGSEGGQLTIWSSILPEQHRWRVGRVDALGSAINTAVRDEEHVVVGMDNGNVVVFQRASLKEHVRLRRRGGRVRSVALHGQTCYVATDAGELRAVSTVTGKKRFAVKAAHPAVFCVAVAEDGRTIATSGSDNAVRIWDAETGAAVGTLYDAAGRVVWAGTLYVNTPNETGVGHRDPCHHLLAMPGGGWLSLDKEIIHWSREGEVVRRVDVAWAPKDVARRGDRIAVLSPCWFQVLDDELELCWGRPLDIGSASAIAWLDDDTVAVGFRSGVVQVFSRTPGNARRHRSTPGHVTVAGERAVVTDADGGATLLTPALEERVLGGLPRVSHSPVASVEARGHVAIGAEKRIHLYSPAGEQTGRLDVGANVSVLHHCGERDVAVGTVMGPLLLASGGELQELRPGPEHTVEIAHHGDRLFVVTRDPLSDEILAPAVHALRCIDLTTRELLWEVTGIKRDDPSRSGELFYIAPVVVLPDGRLFTGSGESAAFVERDPATGEAVRTMTEIEGHLLAAAFVHDSLRLVERRDQSVLLQVVDDEGVDLFDLGPVRSVAFFKDGLLLASAFELRAWSHDLETLEGIDMRPARVGASLASNRCVVATSEGLVVFDAEV